MPEALKNIYDKEFIKNLGRKINTAYKSFDAKQFLSDVIDEEWETLELRARMKRIVEVLGAHLPRRYEDALKVLFAIDGDCTGFPYLFFPDFVAAYGQGEKHWDLSMNALERFTRLSSSEFAVRPFILRDPERAMRHMKKWAGSPNEHVRRFSSEGCRPRLPWGVSLPVFKKNPAPVLEILEILKADPSVYVRKSVANNLNDISKDNPATIIETAARWKGNNAYTDWIIKQGCRTLVRRADPEVMKLFGYADKAESLAENITFSVTPASLKIGESCELKYSFYAREGKMHRIRLEYGIDFVKAGGKAFRKLFLLADKTVQGATLITGRRRHDWSDLTTRRHYEGKHKIALLLNGHEHAHAFVNLRVK